MAKKKANKKNSRNKAAVKEAQRQREEAKRQAMLDREMADRKQSMLQDLFLAVVLFVVFIMREHTFDMLGQLLGLVMSWLVGLIVVDLFYLARRKPRPVDWKKRILPAAGIGVVVFVLAFVIPARMLGL
ncbi:hypothetical protein [Corynebacterium sp. 321]|uniref:hypothetical protein n=1 Tax=Corynebacterium sp. 321 TaxID=2651047 RepID=UPI001300E4A1|nr:hypothetical protein [Corynebacterium sp. 321]KAB1550686.1 hypothetical protein F7233_09110 [Corynebacterium sp. 321]